MVDPGARKVDFKVLELPVPLPAEHFRLEYRLYDKYQRRVHGDKQTVKPWAILARCCGMRQDRGMKLCTEHMQGICCLPRRSQLLLCCACASSGTCCTLCRSECLAAVTSDGNLQCGYQELAMQIPHSLSCMLADRKRVPTIPGGVSHLSGRTCCRVYTAPSRGVWDLPSTVLAEW